MYVATTGMNLAAAVTGGAVVIAVASAHADAIAYLVNVTAERGGMAQQRRFGQPRIERRHRVGPHNTEGSM
jgi:hypothetical protein